jgi:hypothetical protein
MRAMGASDVTAFLSKLAEKHNIAAARQNQALAAILFIYAGITNSSIGPSCAS